jgi:hypothetical protein
MSRGKQKNKDWAVSKKYQLYILNTSGLGLNKRQPNPRFLLITYSATVRGAAQIGSDQSSQPVSIKYFLHFVKI